MQTRDAIKFALAASNGAVLSAIDEMSQMSHRSHVTDARRTARVSV